MAHKILMPQLGEAVVEGTIVEWFVKVGDRVERGDALVEIETDKANTEVPSTVSGFVSLILEPTGATVDVGVTLAEVSDEIENITVKADSPAPEAAGEVAAPAPKAPAPKAPKAPAPKAPTGEAVTQAVTPESPSEVRSSTSASADRPWNADNIVASPTVVPTTLALAQRSAAGAEALKVATTPSSVVSYGAPNAGVYGAPAGGKYYNTPVVSADKGDRVVPFNKRRGIIAEHMVYSKHVSPHVPCFAEVDVTDVMTLRAKHKDRLAAQGIRLSLLAFVLKATCETLREIPRMNSVVGTDEIIERQRVNLGCAVETEAGLLVPVIRDADTLSVSGLAKAVDDLASRARAKKITLDDLSGGTFTVTNPGRRGNLFGAAIINQPQVGILRLGEMRRRVVVREIDGEETICIRTMMFLGLSYDHRIIDGVAGNAFLYRVRELLEVASFTV